MRQPTPIEQAYAWHTNALKGVYGEPIIINPDDPKPGWYSRRLAKAGVAVPARIWIASDVDIGTGELLDDEKLLCEVDGVRCDAAEQWSYLADNPITEDEFRFLTERRRYAQTYTPDDPIARPREAVDWLKVPLPNPRKD